MPANQLKMLRHKFLPQILQIASKAARVPKKHTQTNLVLQNNRIKKLLTLKILKRLQEQSDCSILMRPLDSTYVCMYLLALIYLIYLHIYTTQSHTKKLI